MKPDRDEMILAVTLSYTNAEPEAPGALIFNRATTFVDDWIKAYEEASPSSLPEPFCSYCERFHPRGQSCQVKA